MLYESDEISWDKLESLRKKNVCAVCGGWLNMFLGDMGKAFIACADWPRSHHEGIAKEARYFKENIPTRRERMKKEIGTEKTSMLEKYSYGALATESDAMKILETIWPKAPALEKKKAAMLCVQYQLNPLMRHIFLVPFNKGKPTETWATVLGIQANRLIAHRAGAFSYIDNTPRVMNKEEQELIFGEVFDDRIWAITKLKDANGNQAVGYGSWMKAENPYGSEKGNTKANMAFIRSERQAMDRLFAGKMPEQQFEVADERYIDTSTGEIIDVEPETVAEVPKPEETTEVPPEASVPQTEQTDFDPEELKQSLKDVKWTDSTVKSYLANVYKVKVGKEDTVVDIVSKLNREERERFFKEISDRKSML